MSIKEFMPTKNIKVDVVMKDGRKFLGCDLLEDPDTSNPNVFQFWLPELKNTLRIVPILDILHIDYYNEE